MYNGGRDCSVYTCQGSCDTSCDDNRHTTGCDYGCDADRTDASYTKQCKSNSYNCGNGGEGDSSTWGDSMTIIIVITVRVIGVHTGHCAASKQCMPCVNCVSGLTALQDCLYTANANTGLR